MIGGTARSSFGSITEQTNTKVASLLQVLVSVPLQRQKLLEMIETMIYRYAVSMLIAVRRKKSE